MLRNALRLGYRGAINHYVGMSHYFRLDGGLASGGINVAAAAWHRDFAQGARALGYEVIWSLSYELLDRHCPDAWKQRAADGSPAQTGYTPPSALLSPAHGGARGYLQGIAAAFMGVAGDAGLVKRFQVGEPWSWVDGGGRPCIYDAAAVAAFAPVAVPSVRGSLSAAQKATLDAAGASLAASTAALVAASGCAVSHLLAYLTAAALEAMVTTLTCVRVTPPGPMPSATPGRALSAPDRMAGTTILHVADVPGLVDSPLAAPRLTVIAAGTGAGWRRAALLYSLDDGASWRDGGETAVPAMIGTLASVPAAAPATLVDLINTVVIDLARADMVLVDADDAALDRGGNLALAGGELLQFGRAEQIGPARWRLSHLWRGRRGTEAAAGTQAIGDRFALLAPDALAAIEVPVAAIGSTVRVLASGIGDTAGPVEADCVIDGASVRPPSPAHLRLAVIAGAPTLTWARRSRAGFRWIDGGDVPLAEESEAYRITIDPPAAAPRALIQRERACPLDPADAVAGTIVRVRQIGMLAESLPAQIAIS